MTAGPASQSLGTRRDRPHNPNGWHPNRGDLPPDHQGGGERPPLRTNLTPPTTKETP